jgi:hypothetical protein
MKRPQPHWLFRSRRPYRRDHEDIVTHPDALNENGHTRVAMRQTPAADRLAAL